jgi:hypothetical protein
MTHFITNSDVPQVSSESRIQTTKLDVIKLSGLRKLCMHSDPIAHFAAQIVQGSEEGDYFPPTLRTGY